jgi:hypothetical protein
MTTENAAADAATAFMMTANNTTNFFAAQQQPNNNTALLQAAPQAATMTTTQTPLTAPPALLQNANLNMNGNIPNNNTNGMTNWIANFAAFQAMQQQIQQQQQQQSAQQSAQQQAIPDASGVAALPTVDQAVHSQQQPARPTYVNAKQYRRILKRREARRVLEAYYLRRRQVAAQKKPYMHESRHRHAMKRPRGPGGRFLTKPELVEFYKKHPNPEQEQMFLGGTATKE